MKKKLLLSSVAALTLFAAYNTASAESTNGDAWFDAKPSLTAPISGVEEKAVERTTDPSVKVEDNKTPNKLEGLSEIANDQFFGDHFTADNRKKIDVEYKNLTDYIDNTDNDLTVADLMIKEEYDKVRAELANKKFEKLTVRDKYGKEFVFQGKKIEVKSVPGTHTVQVTTKNGTYKISVLVYNNKAVITNLPQLVANAQRNGWVSAENGSWSYLKDGVKATGWLQDAGSWYYLGQDGVMKKWWVQVDGTWYYLNGSGAMQTGWLQDNGSWYYLEASGALKVNQWFEVDGKWYHVDASGALSVNTTVDGYNVNANGEWV